MALRSSFYIWMSRKTTLFVPPKLAPRPGPLPQNTGSTQVCPPDFPPPSHSALSEPDKPADYVDECSFSIDPEQLNEIVALAQSCS